MDAVVLTRSIVVHDVGKIRPILDSLFTFAVAERYVSLSTNFVKNDPSWTVQRALDNQLIYWDGSEIAGSLGKIAVPPMLLHSIHLHAGRNAGCSIQLLQHRTARNSASADDNNEAFAISALLHRLMAASISGDDTIPLSELLGSAVINSPSTPLANRRVTIPHCLDLQELDTPVTAANFSRFVKGLKENSKEHPGTTCVAFLNARNAPFADAFLVFNELTIFIQEKRSVMATETVTEKKRPSMCVSWLLRRCSRVDTNQSVVTEEHRKVTQVMKADDIFVYMTDQAPIMLTGLPPRTLVVTPELHVSLLGELLAWLRTSVVEEHSDVR
jgi:hypothetical protein